MNDREQTDELRKAQLTREAVEQEQAGAATVEQETAQHERRADKARYLREKLDERAAAEENQQQGSQQQGS